MAKNKRTSAQPSPIRPPKGIPANSRWRRTRSEAIERLGNPTRLQVELIDRMILNLIEAETALRVAATEPIQVGPRGQSVEHPGFRIAARCEASAVSIATKLGVIEVVRPEAPEDEGETTPVEKVEDELAAIRRRKSSA